MMDSHYHPPLTRPTPIVDYKITSSDFNSCQAKFLRVRDSAKEIINLLKQSRIQASIQVDRDGLLKDTLKIYCDDGSDVPRLIRALTRTHVKQDAAWTRRDRLRSSTQAPRIAAAITQTVPAQTHQALAELFLGENHPTY